MPTRLVMTLLVRDEEDIVGQMLEAHFALGVDFVVATDNGSVDGTTAILRRYERRGLLRLIHEPEDNYQQDAWVTRMARLAAVDHDADWVINADADEFWWPKNGDLRSTLAGVPADVSMLGARRFNFVVRDEGRRPFHATMLWRRTDSLTEDGAEMAVKVCHRAAAHVEVAVGNHAVSNLDGGVLDDGRIEILHFPHRSFAQYERKVRQGAAALARNEDFGPEIGYHWRRAAELQAAGELPAAWHRWAHDDERLAAALASGEVVEDRRLLDLLGPGRRRFPFMRALRPLHLM